MTLLANMDRLVYATRLDRIIFMKMQPRTLRWTPLLVVAALIAGYVLMARESAAAPGRTFFGGWLLFYGAYLLAAWLRIFGPRFRATALGPLDERELNVKARAYAWSGILLVSFAMLGCCYMATADILRLWHPRMPNDWISLALGIQACAILLPTWIASWIEPRPLADGEG